MNARQRIIKFFERNDGEELTQEDVCIKFNISQSHASRELKDLRDSGVLDRRLVENGHGGGVYVYFLREKNIARGSIYVQDGRRIPTL